MSDVETLCDGGWRRILPIFSDILKCKTKLNKHMDGVNTVCAGEMYRKILPADIGIE